MVNQWISLVQCRAFLILLINNARMLKYKYGIKLFNFCEAVSLSNICYTLTL